MTTWHPISTAPRDGTFVALKTRSGREIVGFYANGAGWMQDDGWFYCDPVEWHATPPTTGE